MFMNLSDLSFVPVTAAEIEFYLFGAGSRDLSGFESELREACETAGVGLLNFEKERGSEQFEVATKPCKDPQKTVLELKFLREKIGELAQKHEIQASFAAKPFAEDYGSGLHIHIHLENEAGKNMFFKKDEIISDELKYSIGGLLKRLPEAMPVFAPSEESFSRFVPGKNAPVTVSWGANNRTCALRLPDSDCDKKRIEHRAACADADFSAVMNEILAGIYDGITGKISPPPQIYGDASLAIYCLPPLKPEAFR